MERSGAGIHLHTMLLHKLVITMQQEMHLLPAISQLTAVKAADGTYSYYSVFHSANFLQKYNFLPNQQNNCP
jgi:hypothetical protein